MEKKEKRHSGGFQIRWKLWVRVVWRKMMKCGIYRWRNPKLPHLQSLMESWPPPEMEEDPRERRSQLPTILATFSRFCKTSRAEAWTFLVVRLRIGVEWATSRNILGCTSEISSNGIETARFSAHTLLHTLFLFSNIYSYVHTILQ